METMGEDDIAIVVDVTGTYTTKNFVVEKCYSNIMLNFVRKALGDGQGNPFL